MQSNPYVLTYIFVRQTTSAIESEQGRPNRRLDGSRCTVPIRRLRFLWWKPTHWNRQSFVQPMYLIGSDDKAMNNWKPTYGGAPHNMTRRPAGILPTFLQMTLPLTILRVGIANAARPSITRTKATQPDASFPNRCQTFSTDSPRSQHPSTVLADPGFGLQTLITLLGPWIRTLRP